MAYLVSAKPKGSYTAWFDGYIYIQGDKSKWARSEVANAVSNQLT